MANQIFAQIITIFIALLLIVVGSILIQRKRMNIPVGRPPVFSIPLRGVGAVIFGLAAVLCGILMIGFVIFAFIASDSNFWANSVAILQVIVIAGLLGGFAIGIVMQTLMLFVNAVDRSHKGK